MNSEVSNNKISPKALDALMRLGKTYEVGGAVRDKMLRVSEDGKDCDYLVCGAPLEKITETLRKFGRVDLVGKSFGVIKYTEFSRDGEDTITRTFDIALPRTEKSVGVGHKDFDVVFDPEIPVESDLRRRDFTINSMAIALDDGKLIDPLGGKEDVANRILRVNTNESFDEDPLRMLRAAQFAARFNLMLEPVTMALVKEHAKLVTTISPERIAEELNKLLTRARRPSAGFRIMRDTGLLEHILPELQVCVGVEQPGGFHRWDVFEHTIRVIDSSPPRLRSRLAALFHDINKPRAKQEVEGGATFYGHESMGARTTRKVMRRLRYSNELTSEVETLVERHMFTTAVTDRGLRRLIRRVGLDLIFDLLDLRRADVLGQGMGGNVDDVDQFEANIRAEIDRKPPFGLADLEIDGKVLMSTMNLAPGPTIGKTLNYLLEKVLDNPADNTPEKLLDFARSFLNGKIPSSNGDSPQDLCA
ncbi:MAG: HDIG domain-containing protein [candidate division Zixibacteria bacterium]|nr:HDIG domain-containing protein [candidate division Zixibacteria bacterium]